MLIKLSMRVIIEVLVFSLVTVSQPIMEVISELLKDIHMIRRISSSHYVRLTYHVSMFELKSLSLAKISLFPLLSIQILHIPTLHMLHVHLTLNTIHV